LVLEVLSKWDNMNNLEQKIVRKVLTRNKGNNKITELRTIL
jgi:hypothetical protein